MSTPASPNAHPPLHQWEISPQDVARMQRDGADFLFIDCRKPDEYDTASIAGAKLIPMHDLDLHKDELDPYRTKPIVIHCHTGRRSMTMTTVLRAQGFTKVKSMAGGIERWSLEIDPKVPRY